MWFPDFLSVSHRFCGTAELTVPPCGVGRAHPCRRVRGRLRARAAVRMRLRAGLGTVGDRRPRRRVRPVFGLGELVRRQQGGGNTGAVDAS